MGVGSWISKYLDEPILEKFICVFILFSFSCLRNKLEIGDLMLLFPTRFLIQNIREQMKSFTINFKFLKANEIQALFFIGKDCEKVDVPIQAIEKQVLVELYQKEWKEWHN